MKNRINKLNEFLKKYGLIVFIIILSSFKLISILNIPIWAISNAAVDDRLMINIANSLLSKDWLGGYNQYTLVKGLFFPVVLAGSHIIGIPYTIVITLLYIMACILFIYMLRNILKNKLLIGIIFCMLLFNPVSTSLTSFSRVYRNCLTPIQVLIILAASLEVYFRINKEENFITIIWSIITGLVLASFYNTREDYIWIMPYMIFILVITLIKVLIKKYEIKKIIKKSIIIMLPVFILILINFIISCLNYYCYGIFTTNELNNSNFTLAMKSIYSVKNNEEIEHVSVTREKLERIYAVSPTLNYLKEDLNNSIDIYKSADRNPSDNEVEDGWFFWCLRHAVSTKGGYENAQKANEIYLNIHNEIEIAIKDGKLESQKIMPSALMSPWRSGYFLKLVNKIGEIVSFISTYKDTSANCVESISDGGQGIELFEVLTNNQAIYPTHDNELEINNRNLYIDRINNINKIYEKTGIIFLISGILSYIIIIIKTIIELKNKEYTSLQQFFVLSGILGSLMVLITGVAYNEIASCPSINSMYLSGAYPLYISFTSIGSLIIFDIMIKYLQRKMKGIKIWNKKK